MKEYKLVKNRPKYWEFIRKVRNLESVKKGFISQEKISIQSQKEYMEKNEDNFWICLENDIPVGYVGVINHDIRVATHPDHQKKGVGAFMINELSRLRPKAFAKIKIENYASLKLFEKCGFVKKYYILEREKSD